MDRLMQVTLPIAFEPLQITIDPPQIFYLKQQWKGLNDDLFNCKVFLLNHRRCYMLLLLFMLAEAGMDVQSARKKWCHKIPMPDFKNYLYLHQNLKSRSAVINLLCCTRPNTINVFPAAIAILLLTIDRKCHRVCINAPPVWNCHFDLPVSASNAKKLPSVVPLKISPPAVDNTPPWWWLQLELPFNITSGRV